MAKTILGQAIKDSTGKTIGYTDASGQQRDINNDTVLPVTTPPSSTDQITSMPAFKTPTKTYQIPDISFASSAIAGSKSDTTSMAKNAEEEYQRQLDFAKTQQKEGQSFISTLLKGSENTRADAQKNALSTVEDQYGIDLKETIAKRTAAEEEATTLEKDLTDTILRRDEEIAKIREAGGGLESGMNAEINRIEKDYATILNSKSAALNAKASYVKLLQGNVTEAQNLIDKAVDYAVADQRDRVELYAKAWDMNQESLNSINSVYKDAFATRMQLEEKELDRQYTERQQIGEYVLALAKEGIDASSALADPSMTPERFLQRYGGSLASANKEGGGISTTTGNQAYVNAFNSALLGLPAQMQKGATATMQSYLSRGDLAGAREYLTSMAVQGMPAADQTQTLGRASATAALKEINSLMAEAKAKGSPTNLLTGSLVDVSSKLGLTSDEDLAYIGTRLAVQLQVYRRAMTGVAFNPGEAAEYEKIFPNIKNIDTLNSARVQALTDTFDTNNRAVMGFLLGGQTNYDQIYGAPTTPSLPSQNVTPDRATAELDAIVNKGGINPEVGSGSWWSRFTNIFGF